MMMQGAIRLIATFLGVIATSVWVVAADGAKADGVQENLSGMSGEVTSTRGILPPEVRDEVFSRAKALYDSGYYEQAASEYESLYNSGWTGLELCYNAGTAHLQAGNLGRASLYFERAKQFSPSDRELQLNHEFAERLKVDEIEVLPRPLLITIYTKVARSLAWMGWLRLAGTCAWLAGIIYFISRMDSLRDRWRRLIGGFTLGFAVASLIMGFIGIQQRVHAENHQPAVILDDSVYAKNEPNEASTDLFILHEGTVIDAGRTIGSWTKIELADGKVGWVSSVSLEAI